MTEHLGSVDNLAYFSWCRVEFCAEFYYSLTGHCVFDCCNVVVNVVCLNCILQEYFTITVLVKRQY